VTKDKLYVSEIFDSIQGEGPFMGRPCTFIRLGYCNLRCVWCDAWYTWDAHRVSLKETLREVSIDDVRAAIKQQFVVVTGGEPLLQQDVLWELIARTPVRTWQFETNGTVIPKHNGKHLLHYVVSPKLSNNVQDSGKRRIKPSALMHFVINTAASFKFVVDGELDMIEVQDLIHEFRIPQTRVWLMPLGTTAQDINQRAQWLIEKCKHYGYNYSDRLHIRVYGDRRGT
jgi:7-carboxy-7-deazaguanine synthase